MSTIAVFVNHSSVPPCSWLEFVEKTTATEKSAALASVYSLFETTRGILKKHGSDAMAFGKVAIVVLNQVVRPFTEKWHEPSESGAFENREKCAEFREDLRGLQISLKKYAKLLADIAMVEDLTELETTE